MIFNIFVGYDFSNGNIAHNNLKYISHLDTGKNWISFSAETEEASNKLLLERNVESETQ